MAKPEGSTSIPVYAGAVVKTEDGRILCQLRDDKPGVVSPGMWTCSPGGRLEAGETPSQGVTRELREEFEIEVTGLRALPAHVEADGEYRGVYHAFSAQLKTPLEDVKCNEGARAEFYIPEKALELPQHPVSLVFLRYFLELHAE